MHGNLSQGNGDVQLLCSKWREVLSEPLSSKNNHWTVISNHMLLAKNRRSENLAYLLSLARRLRRPLHTQLHWVALRYAQSTFTCIITEISGLFTIKNNRELLRSFMADAFWISNSVSFNFPQRTGRLSHKCNNKEINSNNFKLHSTVLWPK